MALLIDGYNLLYATNIFGQSRGAGGFQASREALLTFLATSLHDKERAQTTIVFDAADAPPGLTGQQQCDGMEVLFARDYPDADALLEEIIEHTPAPRSLQVVSSDHRVQRAARRRGCKYTDSEQWYSELWQRRIELRRARERAIPEKPMGQLSPAEIAYWLAQFKLEEELLDLAADLQPPGESQPESELPFENPFPPGYADDLFEDEPPA